MKTYRTIFIALGSLALTDSFMLPAYPIKTAVPWESVASSIIQRYKSAMYDVGIISELHTSVSDNFLRTISVPIHFSSYRLHEDSHVFLLPHTRSFVSSVLEKVANFTKSKYVVLMDCDDCVSIPWILQQFWQQNLLHVVVIPIQNETISVYSYFPFREGACFDSSPVLLDTYTDGFLRNAELFPIRKVWNLHQCTLKISTFTSLVVHLENGEMKGSFSPVFKAVVESMNFSPEFFNTKGEGYYGRASGPVISGIRGDVFKRRAHMGFGYLLPMDFNYIDYDLQPMTACLTWCTPASYKKSLWWLIVGEFDIYIWLILFLSALCMVAVNFVAQKFGARTWSDGAGEMYMNVWSALLQGPGKIPRYSTMSFRVYWISWLMSCVVLSTAYLSTLKSLRTAPFLEYSIKTLEGLADAGLEAWYPDGLTAVVHDASATNQAIAKIRSKSHMYPAGLAGYMLKQMRYKNITSLTMDFICRMFSESYGNVVELYPIPKACMQVSSWHYFAMGRNSVFSEAVRTLMGRLTQSGIVQTTLMPKKSLQKSADIKRRPITLHNSLPIFSLLGYGWTVGVIALVGEIFAMRLRRKKYRYVPKNRNGIALQTTSKDLNVRYPENKTKFREKPNKKFPHPKP